MDFEKLLKELNNTDFTNLSKRETNKIFKEQDKLRIFIELDKIMKDNDYSDKYVFLLGENLAKVENISFKIQRKKPVFTLTLYSVDKQIVKRTKTGSDMHITWHTHYKLTVTEPKIIKLVNNIGSILTCPGGIYIDSYYVNPEI